MRKLLIPSLVLVAAAGLAVAATALGARSTAAAAAASPAAPRLAEPRRGRRPHDRRPTTRRSRRGSAAARRRSRGRSPTRTAARATSRPSRTRSPSQLGFAKSAGEVDGRRRSTTRTARARSRSTSTSTRSRISPRAREGGRLLEVVLLRQPGGRRPQGQADREGALDRRPQAVQARGAGRHDELLLHRRQHQAVVEPARLRHERRGGAGAEERPDRRHRRRPADGVLRHRRAGRRTA